MMNVSRIAVCLIVLGWTQDGAARIFEPQKNWAQTGAQCLGGETPAQRARDAPDGACLEVKKATPPLLQVGIHGAPLYWSSNRDIAIVACESGCWLSALPALLPARPRRMSVDDMMLVSFPTRPER